MLSSRPHLISSDRHLEINLDSAKPAHLVIDGQKTIGVGSSDDDNRYSGLNTRPFLSMSDGISLRRWIRNSENSEIIHRLFLQSTNSEFLIFMFRNLDSFIRTRDPHLKSSGFE